MAHAHADVYAKRVTASIDGDGTTDVSINCDRFRICMSREEAAQLAADLLNVVEASPVDAQQVVA